MLVIDRLVIHRVDHHNADSPTLSDLETTISEPVADFLREAILTNREHKNARTAVFEPEPDPQRSVAALAEQMLQRPQEFVPASRAIAERLFAVVRGDHRISPSDLLLCSYRPEENAAPRLALLKMEPQNSFAGDFETVNGARRFVLRPVDNVLPRGELQKSAFILSPAERSSRGYDLRLVDQQIARYGARRPVASFFSAGFLHCRVLLNAADQTQRYLIGSYQWLRGVEDAWPAQQTAVFKERLRTSLLDNEIDLTAVAEAAIPEPQQQEAYLDFMVAQGLETLRFAPDPAGRERWTRLVTYSGDNELQVRVAAEHIGRGETVDPRFDPATGLWTVVITTTRWEEERP